MPRFFFHVTQGNERELDKEGLDLADESLARIESLEALRTLKAELAPEDWARWSLEVVDELGATILQIGFGKIPLAALILFQRLYACLDVLPT